MVRADEDGIKNAEVYERPPGTNVIDMHHDVSSHEKRLLDLEFIMLWFANKLVLTQTQVCDYKMMLAPHLKMRKYRIHEGAPGLGPDGRCVVIRGEVYNGGDDSLDVSDLIVYEHGQTGPNDIKDHPKYANWLHGLLWPGGDAAEDGYLDRNGKIPPGRKGSKEVPRAVSVASSAFSTPARADGNLMNSFGKRA
jgi:hypothetical protein